MRDRKKFQNVAGPGMIIIKLLKLKKEEEREKYRNNHLKRNRKRIHRVRTSIKLRILIE